MQGFSSILVYVDPNQSDENTVPEFGIELAPKAGTSSSLASVFEDVPAYARLLLPPEWDAEGVIVAQHSTLLSRIAKQFTDTALPLESHVLRGKPPLALTHQVLKDQHDLLIKAAKRQDSGGLHYGPLASSLLRICPCPIMILQPNLRKPMRCIIAAVDPGVDDQENTDLNLRIIDTSRHIAQICGAELQIVHVWDAFAANMVKTRVARDELSEYVVQHERAAQDRLALLLSHAGKSTVDEKLILLRGDASEAIPKFADNQNADLVVMGSVCQTRLSGIFFGNTAEMVLRQLDCSFLAIKPATYRSPVQQPRADAS